MSNDGEAVSLQYNRSPQKALRHPEDLGNSGNAEAKRGIVRIESLLSSYLPRLSGADRAHVRRLAEAGNKLPPIIVHRPTMMIIDGTHRVQAAMLKGNQEIEAEFFDGSEDEAFVRAVELNIAHGLPLTMTERKLAAARIIASCPELSDRAIARSSGLSDKTVARIRRWAAGDTPPHPPDGREGRRRATQIITARPDAPLREVARLAGISVSTAKNVRDQLERGRDPLLPERKKPAGTSPAFITPPSSVRDASAEPKSALQNAFFILDKLKRDPSLRFSDSGREFLRLLQLQCEVLGKWQQLSGKLPDHCTPIVMQFARQCAAEWGSAAEALPKLSTSR